MLMRMSEEQMEPTSESHSRFLVHSPVNAVQKIPPKKSRKETGPIDLLL
jgi:hypothetical protein